MCGMRFENNFCVMMGLRCELSYRISVFSVVFVFMLFGCMRYCERVDKEGVRENRQKSSIDVSKVLFTFNQEYLPLDTERLPYTYSGACREFGYVLRYRGRDGRGIEVGVVDVYGRYFLMVGSRFNRGYAEEFGYLEGFIGLLDSFGYGYDKYYDTLDVPYRLWVLTVSDTVEYGRDVGGKEWVLSYMDLDTVLGVYIVSRLLNLSESELRRAIDVGVRFLVRSLNIGKSRLVLYIIPVPYYFCEVEDGGSIWLCAYSLSEWRIERLSKISDHWIDLVGVEVLVYDSVRGYSTVVGYMVYGSGWKPFASLCD